MLEAAARERALTQAVDDEVLNGGSLLTRSPLTASMGYRRPVSHGAHAVLTVLSGGVWALVWLVMTLSRTEDRARLVVDEHGHVWLDEPVR